MNCVVIQEISHSKNVPDQVHGGHHENDKDSAMLHEHDQVTICYVTTFYNP